MSDGYPPNFRPAELHCKCNGQFCEGASPHPDRTRHLAWVLQQIRDDTGAPIHINSGYRCPAYNEQVGGSTQSYHMTGMAADLACAAVSPEELADTVEGLMDEGGVPDGGLGRYNTFTHVDIRQTKARWTG